MTKKLNFKTIKLWLVSSVILFSYSAKSQHIFELMNQDGVSLKEARKEADKYFKQDKKGKGSGYKLFKRWEHHALTKLQPDGTLISREVVSNALKNSKNATSNKSISSSNWTELGPLSVTNTSGYNPGVGRITAIAVEPINQQIIYVGSPGGGLWKSINAGNSWTPLGDQFDNMSIWSIEIDPTNINTVYIGNNSGDLYKSINGGSSFSLILNKTSSITDILINPTNTNDMYAALRNDGLYRTTDGGSNWTKVISSGIEDVQYKPGSTSTVYACGRDFYKSTNSGTSFSKITSGIVATDRMKLAVSAANSNYVYIVQAKGSQFGQLYRSTDNGANFTVQVDHQVDNYIGNQASRDMAVTVSNTNINEVHIGGFNMYKSTNGGTSFAKECDWYYPNTTSGNYGYVHADIEVLQYINGKIYVGSDGGIFRSDNGGGSSFTDLSTGLGIHQFYRISSSATDKNIVAGGAQDNGSTVMSGPAHQWKHWIGADGMDCAVNPTNANIVFGCIQFGNLKKSINGGNSLTSIIAPPENSQGNWVTPIAIDPSNGNRIYAGYKDLYRHENGAVSSSWINVSSNITFPSKLSNIELCPSNNQVIYVSTSYSGSLYKSSNITSSSPTWIALSGVSGTINDIAVDPFDENRVVVVTSYGYVYLSTNGGSNWTRIDSGLPGVPKKTAVLDKSSDKGIYVAIDGAVYFKSNAVTNWTIFSTNLPKVNITELDLYYGAAGESRIRIGTYGRGLWESPLYDDDNSGGNGGSLVCSSAINIFPYNESFETGFGAWSNATTDDIDWTNQTGSTPSSGTGPTAAADGSKYLYIETSVSKLPN